MRLCWEAGAAGGDRNNWALACTLRVGTKGKCGWICTWPCELCADVLEGVHARSSHSVGRWVGPRDPLIQVRTLSMAVLFGKHSRPERLNRVLRSISCETSFKLHTFNVKIDNFVRVFLLNTFSQSSKSMTFAKLRRLHCHASKVLRLSRKTRKRPHIL